MCYYPSTSGDHCSKSVRDCLLESKDRKDWLRITTVGSYVLVSENDEVNYINKLPNSNINKC